MVYRLNIQMHRLADYDLEKLYEEEKDGEKKVRYLALLHLSKGKNRNEVSEIVFKDWQSIDNWYDRFIAEGPDGLDHKSGQGRKPDLDRQQEEEFRLELEKMQAERPGGRVNAKDIQTMLLEKFKAKYHENSISRLLKRLGMVWITARSKHPNHDPVKQEAFKK